MSVCVWLLTRLWVPLGQKLTLFILESTIPATVLDTVGNCAGYSLFPCPPVIYFFFCTPLTLCVPQLWGDGRSWFCWLYTLFLLASGFQFGWVNRRHERKLKDARQEMARDSFLLSWVGDWPQIQLLQQGCPLGGCSHRRVSALLILIWLSILRWLSLSCPASVN